jgi:predicted metalloprotease
VIVAALAVAGCGSGNGGGGASTATVPEGKVQSPLPEAVSGDNTKPADRSAGSPVPQAPRLSALAPAARKQVAAMDVRPAPQRAAAAQGSAAPPEASQANYDRFVRAVIPLINSFWEKKTREFSPTARYEPPGDLIAYAGENSPGCAGETSAGASHNAYYCASIVPYDRCATPARNLGYCSGKDIIAWDEPGLLLPFYRQIGGLAAALVLAHEWGHLVQARVYPQFNYKTTIRIELQADCYAGAWALEMKRQGRVDVGAFNQTLDLFETIGGPGEAWLDPSSHGNKFQRIRAFTQGFENDAEGCVGAQFDAVLDHVGLGAES